MEDDNYLPMHNVNLKTTASILYEFLEFGLPLLESRAKIATSMRFMNVHACRSAVGRSTLNSAAAPFYGVGKQS